MPERDSEILFLPCASRVEELLAAELHRIAWRVRRAAGGAGARRWI